jgi:MtN3 and saliva related transmembrane protein
MPWQQFWSAVGLAAAALTATSFIPQIISQLRRPDCSRVSYGTLSAFILGATLWTAYGVHLRDAIIIGANLFILSTLIILVCLQAFHRTPKR